MSIEMHIKNQMKDHIIIALVSASLASTGWLLQFVLGLNSRIVSMEANNIFIEKQLNECVKNDTFQLEKMLILEKVKRP